jgi:hypothetical protein
MTLATSLIGTPSETSQVAYECRRSWKRRLIGRPARLSDGFHTRDRNVPRLSGSPVRVTKIRPFSPGGYSRRWV